MLGKNKTTKETAVSIKENFDTIVTDALNLKGEVVLKDFIRKDTERQVEIANLKNAIKGVESSIVTYTEKLDKAEKVSNQAALTKKITFANCEKTNLEAEITEIETLRTNAATKRDAFIKAFDDSPFDALANSDLVRSKVMDKLQTM